MTPLPGQSSRGQLRPRLIDINFIPPAYRRKSLSAPSRRLLILCLALLVGLAYLASLYRAQQEEIAFLEPRVGVLDKELASLEKAKPEFDKMQASIKAADERLAELDQTRGSLPTASWGVIVGAVGSALSDRVTLRSLAQEKRSVTVAGQAADFPALVEYGAKLKTALQRVGVEAQVNYRQAGAPPPTPVVLGTPTPTPRVPLTPTPTPLPGISFVLVVDVISGGGP